MKINKGLIKEAKNLWLLRGYDFDIDMANYNRFVVFKLYKIGIAFQWAAVAVTVDPSRYEEAFKFGQQKLEEIIKFCDNGRA